MTKSNFLDRFNSQIVVQARLGSTRLPRKVLMPFGSSTVLGHLLSRLIESGLRKEQIVLAIPNTPSDDDLFNYIQCLDIPTFRGSENSCLHRIAECIRPSSTLHFVRLTADNPLIYVPLIEECLRLHVEKNAFFTSNRLVKEGVKIDRFWPKGQSVDVFQKEYFLSNVPFIDCISDHEHVVPYFFRNGTVNLVKKEITELYDFSFPYDNFTIDDIGELQALRDFYELHQDW